MQVGSPSSESRRDFLTRRVTGGFCAAVLTAAATVISRHGAAGFRGERLRVAVKAKHKIPVQDYKRAVYSAADRQTIMALSLYAGLGNILSQHITPALKESTDRREDPSASFLQVLLNGPITPSELKPESPTTIFQSSMLNRSGFIKKLSLLVSGSAMLAPMLNMLQDESIQKEAAIYAKQMKLNAAEQTCIEDILAVRSFLRIDLPLSALLNSAAIAALSGSVYRKTISDLRSIVEQVKNLVSARDVDWTNKTITIVGAGIFIDPSIVLLKEGGAKRNFHVTLVNHGQAFNLPYSGNAKYFLANECPGILEPGLYPVYDAASLVPDDSCKGINYLGQVIYEPLKVKPGQNIYISRN